MSKVKVVFGVSGIISLLMSMLSLSQSFFYSIYTIPYSTKLEILSEMFNSIFSLEYMPLLNIALMITFFLNFISFILYFFVGKRKKLIKYISFWNTLLLSIGLILFILHVSSNIVYYDLIDQYYRFSLNYKIYRWIPRVLIFFIPTLGLISSQIYINSKLANLKFKNRTTILSFYISSIILLTALTFLTLSSLMDYMLQYLLKLKIPAIISGDQIIGETHANINHYIFYILALTVIFGAIFGTSKLLSKKKSKQQQL